MSFKRKEEDTLQEKSSKRAVQKFAKRRKGKMITQVVVLISGFLITLFFILYFIFREGRPRLYGLATVESGFILFSYMIGGVYLRFSYRKGREISKAYKKESREKYGEIQNREWTKFYYTEQQKIKNKRVKVFLAITIFSFIIMVPFIIFLILSGKENTSLNIGSAVVLVVVGLVFLYSLICFILCITILKIKEYEIDGFLLIEIKYMSKSELYLDNRLIGAVFSFTDEIKFKLPNNQKVTFYEGIIIKEEDETIPKKSQKR